MANIKFTNFARSTLSIGAASGATSLTLAAGTGLRFPSLGAGEYFYLTLENSSLVREIVKVTARATDVLTVVRAQDNTTAQTWNAGDVAALRLNAAAIEEAVVDTLLAANNLSDVDNVATARSNISALGAGDNIGAATATTPSPGDNSTKVATTAFVQGAVTGAAIQGAFKNLAASATGSSANVTVTVDEIVVESAANLYTPLRAVSLTIAGTSVGANALDAGTIAINTWYSVWVIWDGATTAGLLSTSVTAPTLPSGYTHKARVGWVRTDASGNKYPLAFRQFGRRVRYAPASGANLTALPIASSGANGSPNTPTWVAVGVSTFVPTTASFISLSLYNSGSGVKAICAPNNNYGAYNSATNPPPMLVGAASAANVAVSCCYEMGLESTSVFLGAEASTLLYVTGWEDNL